MVLVSSFDALLTILSHYQEMVTIRVVPEKVMFEAHKQQGFQVFTYLHAYLSGGFEDGWTGLVEFRGEDFDLYRNRGGVHL